MAWVREAVEVLAPTTGHWTFVSSVNVYADPAALGQTPASPLLPVVDAPHSELDETSVEVHGGVKLACEEVVRAAGVPAFFPRPGQITGPGDAMDRFGYWPNRFSRGGRVAVPDNPDQPVLHIDVRDLAAWIVRAGERRQSGTHDAVGPVMRLADVLAEVRSLVAPPGTEVVPIAPSALAEAGVAPRAGPRSMPLWLPPSHYGLFAHDPAPSFAAGLSTRPLAETVVAALAEERARGLDRQRQAGLTPAEEAELLATSA
ncbi:epimerase [Actinokineospora guangxiensis]|uniref:Epimerase n=1 Tax=Actinokineospora guangxiensis TaxID=1490288 RepID=A0ABW0EPW3_9PSEU